MSLPVNLLCFLLIFITTLHLNAFDSSISRLLITVSPSAAFSGQELADALMGEYIHLDGRNPFKDFPKNFLDYPLVVTSYLDPPSLFKLSQRFGYRFVIFSEETLAEAIEVSAELVHLGPKTTHDLPHISQEEAHRIYDLLQKVDHLFQAHGITYWATGGTLMGALRYQGVMPWDDDPDICMLEADEKKLVTLQADLDSLGLVLLKRDIYKIFFKEGAFIENPKQPGSFLSYNFPSVDLFVMTLEEGKEYKDRYVHKAPYFYWHYGSVDGFKYSQIEAITRVPFGPLMLPIPGEAELFLNENYGTTEYPELWKTHSKEPSWDHKLGKPSSIPGAAFVEVIDFSSAD